MPQTQKRNGFAVAALVLGILASCFALIPILGLLSFPMALIGLALGIVGIVGASREVRSGKAMAIVGTVLCGVGLVLAVIGVVIVIRIGNHHRSLSGERSNDAITAGMGHFVSEGTYQNGEEGHTIT